MKKVAVISHPDCLLHDTGKGHPERPDRVATIDKVLRSYPFPAPIEFLEAPLATFDQIKTTHDESYVDWIISIAPQEESIMIDEDTIMSPGTLRAAQLAAGAVILAVDLVMQNKYKTVFCNVRPPGHHAEYEKAMGFCYFNNVAIATLHAFNTYGLERVAIIDFDVHHGNGTQNIFQRDKRVLYCSSFQHPLYPGYDDELDNKHILSIPLTEGMNGSEWREFVKTRWLAQIEAFNPQLIFFSAGFDAHQDDPLAQLNFLPEDYTWITEEIGKIAARCCEGKMVSVLEGGYSLTALAESVPKHVEALMS